MSPFLWYWHRLRAMDLAEMAAHLRKRIFQFFDARGLKAPASGFVATIDFPKLPRPEAAPASLREALARDAKEILSGRWKAFGHLQIQVSDPPEWHKDYLVGKNLETNECAFELNHRALPDGADIKLIWELSRWHQLVRLAMAGFVLGDGRATLKCAEWLADWVRHNPPYRGWNWTSALEAGLRLVQFTWIDTLLSSALAASGQPGGGSEASHGKRAEARAVEGQDAELVLGPLRREILPAHVRFAWRYRSVGSSANNHLLGELSGMILALARWPDLAKYAAPLDCLQRLWEREVMAQFAEDGGNREQALNYHLFSWEFCWQATAALALAGRKISSEVADRLRRAAQYFVDVQMPAEPWDYGDSDDGFVTPTAAFDAARVLEWCSWFQSSEASPAIEYWWSHARLEFEDFRTADSEWKSSDRAPAGSRDTKEAALANSPGSVPLRREARDCRNWLVYNATGIAVCRTGGWQLRLDASPLGYLSTAAHGHLDALHLSLWYQGVAIVIDPGTGAYYADPALRSWLASRPAHNSAYAVGWEDWPRRLGTFLWDRRRLNVDLRECADFGKGDGDADWICARTFLGREANDPPHLYCWRKVIRRQAGNGWTVEDGQESSWPVNVRWQFAPGARLESIRDRKFRVTRKGIALEIEVCDEWAEVHPVAEKDSDAHRRAVTTEWEGRFAGMVSPAFRKVEWAPYLKLVARPGSDKTCVYRTTFLAAD